MPKSNPKLVQACKLWDRVTTKANSGGYPIPKLIDRYRDTFYSPGDYGALSCLIDGDVAEMQVGGSSGHKARIDLRNNTVDYLDNRSNNNRTVWKMFKTALITCKRDDEGVHCKNVNTPLKLAKAFKVLALPASMDFRRDVCENKTTFEKCLLEEVKLFKTVLKDKAVMKEK